MKRMIVLDSPPGTGRTPAPATPHGGVVIGRLVGLDADGHPLVDYPGNANGPVVAAATCACAPADIGREAALLLTTDETNRPLLVGLVVVPAGAPGPGAGLAAAVTVDGDRTTITAARQIVLRCGAASITLTRAGKVLIRGTYLLSRSSGVNRIKGGSIQLN